MITKNQAERKVLFSVSIHDCEIQTFRCGGHGGQNVNKVESGVRLIHHPSGAIARSCDTRDQLRNKRFALKRLADTVKFRRWMRIEAARLEGRKSVEQLIDESMHPSNLLIEIRNAEGRWQVV